MDKQAVGDRVKLMRERAGWSQRELVEAARKHAPEGRRVTRNSISQYENGHANPDSWMLQALADALETSVPFLTGVTDDPSPGPRPTFVAPELWGILETLNDQPPRLRRLAVGVLEAAVEYAAAYASSGQLERIEAGTLEPGGGPGREGLPLDALLVARALTDQEHGEENRRVLAELLAAEVQRQSDSASPGEA